MNIKPMGENIVVRPIEAEVQTKSGLFIPETAKEKPQKGEVLAVGPGKWDELGDKRIPLDVAVGDHVLYKEWGETKIKFMDAELLIMAASTILAIVEDDE